MAVWKRLVFAFFTALYSVVFLPTGCSIREPDYTVISLIVIPTLSLIQQTANFYSCTVSEKYQTNIILQATGDLGVHIMALVLIMSSPNI